MNSELLQDEIDPGLTDRLRSCAEAVGSGDELSRLTGIPRRSLENYLSGKTVPKLKPLLAIAKTAGVSLDWLATGEGPKQRREAMAASSPPVPPPGDQSGQPLPLLPELMKAVIKGMEMAIRKDRMRLSPKQRGLAILALYDISYRRYMVRKAGGTPIDLDQDIDAVALSPDGSALLKLFDEDNRDPHDP